MTLYRRHPDGSTVKDDRDCSPWVASADESLAQRWVDAGASSYPLRGEHPIRTLLAFPSRESFRNATANLEWTDRRHLWIRSATTQFLLASGLTSFKDMVFQDLRRLQLDIETLGLSPEDPAAQIIMVALRQGDREHLAILETSESELLEEVNTIIEEWDPDVIEGHNIFNFDLPFLVERARQSGTTLTFGRDGSSPLVSTTTQRFQAGPQSLPFTSVHIHGRHVIDTYQQVQRWDTLGRLSSYGLKPIIAQLGLERENRVIVEGSQISDMWHSGQRSRDTLARYAMDDVRDVDLLARITLPTEFYQSQVVPMPLQASTIAGSGTKIDHLMIRAYLNAGHSIPVPDSPRAFPGGYVELIESGVFGPVVKCDIESLYPSIMLHHQIAAKSDTLKAFPVVLAELTRRRIEAKRQAAVSTGEEYAVWNGLQGTFKILINSFYGYLGFGRGRFNDYAAAEDVTLKGQEIIQGVVASLRALGAAPIEVDTDGVYFSPPDSVTSYDEELAFVREVSRHLPERIVLAHDGRYRRMLSLKIKNYALVDYEGNLSMTGSSLRSRRMERALRLFLNDAATHFLNDDRDASRERYFELAAAFVDRAVPIDEISQWVMLRQSTIDKHPRIKALLERHPGSWRFGERIEVYDREDGALALVAEYAADENVDVLLRKLRDTAERFRELFESDSEFDAFFPRIKPGTNLAVARERRPIQQLGLF